MSKLPSLFTTMISDLLGNDAESFFDAMSMPPAVSVKLNRRKHAGAAPPFLDREGNSIASSPVKWCASGIYLDSRPAFTLDPRMHAGLYYVQDASSMIYETVVERLLSMGLLSSSGASPLKVADLCAAPGGKTTSMINALPDDAIVLANEFIPQRASILKENILKWGFPNTIVTNSSVDKIADSGIRFDLVAVDAPCSGEGMMRKEEVAVSQWSPALIAQCSALQREILDNAVRMLKEDGVLIYSTCTFNRTENEENVNYLVENYGLLPVDMNFPREWGILPGIDTQAPCYRFMPHATRGEGLFLAVLKKPSATSISSPIDNTGNSWGCSPCCKDRKKGKQQRHNPAKTAKAAETPDFTRYVVGNYPALTEGDRSRLIAPGVETIINALNGKVRILSSGIPAARLKGKDWQPVVPLILSSSFRRGALPECELSLETALKYLRHEAVTLPADIAPGYVALIYNNLPFGLVKNIGTRANNLYPAEWRIRNL